MPEPYNTFPIRHEMTKLRHVRGFPELYVIWVRDESGFLCVGVPCPGRGEGNFEIPNVLCKRKTWFPSVKARSINIFKSINIQQIVWNIQKWGFKVDFGDFENKNLFRHEGIWQMTKFRHFVTKKRDEFVLTKNEKERYVVGAQERNHLASIGSRHLSPLEQGSETRE